MSNGSTHSCTLCCCTKTGSGPKTLLKMLTLCYHTDNEQLISIANRYWMTDENGKYLENSTSFFGQTGATNTTQQTKILANIATAYSLNSRCIICDSPQIIKTRSTQVKNHLHECDDCADAANAEHKRIAAEKLAIEAQQLHEALQRVTAGNRNKAANYQLIEDDAALLILALDRTLGNQLFDIGFGFMRKSCVNLAPGNSWKYVDRLYRDGLLITNPRLSAPDAYFLKDGELWYRNEKIVYEAVPDVTVDSNDIVKILHNRPFDQVDVIRALWIEYATSDCMAYLDAFSAEHGLTTEGDEDSEIENILRTALNTHSVANLWCAIWKIVKDAAALSTRDYYNSRKAAATLPGKLKRHLEAVNKGQKSLGQWDRPRNQIAGSLGDIFYDIWNLDENTLGKELDNIFPKSCDDVEIDELSLNRELVTQILHQAVTHDLAPEVLLTFASEISEGKSLMTALNAAYSIVPR